MGLAYRAHRLVWEILWARGSGDQFPGLAITSDLSVPGAWPGLALFQSAVTSSSGGLRL